MRFETLLPARGLLESIIMIIEEFILSIDRSPVGGGFRDPSILNARRIIEPSIITVVQTVLSEMKVAQVRKHVSPPLIP